MLTDYHLFNFQHSPYANEHFIVPVRAWYTFYEGKWKLVTTSNREAWFQCGKIKMEIAARKRKGE